MFLGNTTAQCVLETSASKAGLRTWREKRNNSNTTYCSVSNNTSYFMHLIHRQLSLTLLPRSNERPSHHHHTVKKQQRKKEARPTPSLHVLLTSELLQYDPMRNNSSALTTRLLTSPRKPKLPGEPSLLLWMDNKTTHCLFSFKGREWGNFWLHNLVILCVFYWL